MKRFERLLLLFLLTVTLCCGTAMAGRIKNKWVSSRGYFYYYNAQGKKLKNGIYEIRGKKYCFDEYGRQRGGWRRIGGKTRFFYPGNKGQGYMVTGKKVDGIWLKKDGTAYPFTERARKKLPILLQVQSIVDGIVRPEQKLYEKCRVCFEYVKSHYTDHTIPDLGHISGDWDLTYAGFMLKNGYGDCYCFGATFAYFANAIGYDNALAVNSGGHGWAEIAGRFYDPEWARVIGSDKCYSVPVSLSGTGGRPNWAAYRTYIKNADT